jgi:hypothetical protein
LFTAVHAGLVYTTSDHKLLEFRADAARLHTIIAPNALPPVLFLAHIIPTHSKSYDINDNDKMLSSPQTYVVNVVYVARQTCRYSSGVGVALGLDSNDPLDRDRIVEKVRLVTGASAPPILRFLPVVAER